MNILVKHRNIYRLIAFFLMWILASPLSFSAEFYVSPAGQNSNPGTKKAPFATLSKALNAVKAEFHHSPDQDCTIWVDQGTYRISEPIRLRSDEFHNQKGALTIAALPGTAPVISGGVEVPKWRRTSDGLWKADLTKLFPKHSEFRELFIDDRRAIRSRYPNEDFLRVAKVGADRRTNFFFEAGDFPIPASVEQTELILLHDWSISRIRVQDIDLSSNKLTTVDSIGARQPAFFNLDNWEPNPRYFLENDLQFLDADDEWYYDKIENVLYLQLPTDQNPNDHNITIPISQGLLNLSGSMERPLKNIRFEGLTFKHAAWIIPDRGYGGVQACHFDPRFTKAESKDLLPPTKGWAVVPAAIKGDWTEHNSFTNCLFKNLGGSGLWFGTGSTNNTISNCTFEDISGNGIMIGEGRDRTVNGQPWWQEAPEQVAKGNKITNNTIRKCGQQFFGAVGIWCGLTAETTIRENEIYDLPYTGISIGWMWSPVPTPCRDNTLENNHIHHIMQQLSDGGGIYMLGLQPGSKILHNRIHDVNLNVGRAESNGLFLDEGTTDVVVANNLIYEIAKSPLRFHRATTNIVRENQFFCKENIRPIRYNTTREGDIIKIDNQVFVVGEPAYQKQLSEAIEQWEARRKEKN